MAADYSNSEIEISVIHWHTQFSKRTKDLKKQHWFSFPNDLLTHPDFFKVSGEEFKWFVWVLSVCSKVMKETVRLNIEHAAHNLHMQTDHFFLMVEKLQGKQVDVPSRPHYGRTATDSRPLHNITVHNNTEQNRTEEYSSVEEKSSSLVPAKISTNEVSVRKANQTFSIQSFHDFGNVLNPTQMTNYFHLYPDEEFFKREFLKMQNWLIGNPKKNRKTLKSWSSFVSRWLDSAWPEHQKRYPSVKVDQSSVGQSETEERIKKLFGEAT